MIFAKGTPEMSATTDWQKVSRSIVVPDVPPLRYVESTPSVCKDGFCVYTATLVGLATAAVAVSAYYSHTKR